MKNNYEQKHKGHSSLRKQKSTLFVIVVTFFATLFCLVLIGGIVYLAVNFDSLKDNISFNKEFNITLYNKEVSKWQNEPNRVEIPALGIIGKLSYAKSKEDEEILLRDSLVQVVGTAPPGENGNVVITGHSSSIYPGIYQNIFATLNKLENGDKVTIYKDSLPYNYEVSGKNVINAEDISVLGQNENKLTLITCWPIGTDMKRLVVTAKVVD